MTAQQAIDAINAVSGRGKMFARNGMAYKTAIEAVNNPGVEQICGQSMGGGNFSSSRSWQTQTANLLRVAGILFTTTNIAPKGGKRGDRITAFLEPITTTTL